jgi:nucleoid DNA-binding protein
MNNARRRILKRRSTMKRSDIIRSMQVRFKQMRDTDAAAMLDATSEHLTDSVAAGERIEIRVFGTFQSRARATKIGYNPATGEPRPLAAGRTILFKPSRELTKKMN